VQEKLVRKKLIRLLLVAISFVLLNVRSLYANSDTLVDYYIFNYVYKRDFITLNLNFNKLTSVQKQELVIDLLTMLSKNGNFICEKVIINKQNIAFYDTVYQTEIINLEKNWRLRQEVISILVQDLINSHIRDFSNRLFYYNSNPLLIVYSGKEKTIIRNKNICRKQIIDKYINKPTLKKIRNNNIRLLKIIRSSGLNSVKVSLEPRLIIR
jgi:hypothetical protein